MKKWLLLWVAVLAACGTLKKETTRATLTKTQQLNVTSEISAAQQWSILTSDSNNTQSLWRIWPKGMVKYHPDSGFAGEVAMMELYRRSKSAATTKASGKTELKANQVLNQRQQEKQIVQSVKKVTLVRWYYWLAGIVLAGAVVWLNRSLVHW